MGTPGRPLSPKGVSRGKTDIKVGYTCNNRCTHCVISDQRDAALARRGSSDRTTREVLSELVDARRRGYSDVVLTGGEPTIRADLSALVGAARKLGFRVHIQTNGRLLSRSAVAERLAPFRAQYVVAIHGHDAGVHDAITRAPGSFDQTIQGVRNLIALDQGVLAKVVLSRGNAPFILEIVALCRRLKIPLVNLAFPHGLGEARRRFDEVVPRYRDVAPGILAALRAHQRALDIGVEAVPACLLPGFEHHISDAPRRDRGCPIEHRQLDAERRTWQRARQEMKRKPESCEACVHDPDCEGPWSEYLERFGPEELIPVHAEPGGRHG